MIWTITYYSDSVQEEILAMPAGFLGSYLRYTDRLEVYGPDLGMPHTRAMGDGLFELRLKSVEGIARVLYCTMVAHCTIRKKPIPPSLTRRSHLSPPPSKKNFLSTSHYYLC